MTTTKNAPSQNASVLSSQEDFNTTIEILKNAARSYYDGSEISMTDFQYDSLLALVEDAVSLHPDWDDKGLLTQVSGGASVGGDVTHKEPMLSIAKAKESSEVDKFLTRIASKVVVEAKLDGLAISATYKKGKLIQVALRGDGYTGEDVTKQTKNINGLPLTLKDKIDIEVRGEVFMTEKDFEVSNFNRVASGKNAFVNPRNATAGALRKIDAEYTNQMSFAAYGCSGDYFDSEDSHYSRMSTLVSLGFITAISLAEKFLPSGVFSSNSSVEKAITTLGAQRGNLGFPIDGAVIKVDSIQERSNIGVIAHTPKWAIAFKYPADTATTILKAIEPAIGRTGHLSLRAVLEPVFVGGTTITYATLHNLKFVSDADFRIGDTVFVRRAGDVIPRVDAVDLSKRPAGTVRWEAPQVCPECGQEWDKTDQIWRCENPECSLVGTLVYWCSRDAMDIDRVGEAVCEALVETGLVNNIADLYDVTLEQWTSLPMGANASGTVRLLGASNAKEILAGLEKSKSQPFNRVVTGLGIRKTGRTVGRWLAKSFTSMEALRAATVEDISRIDKMGTTKATFVVEGLKELAPVIDRLAAHGINMQTTVIAGNKILSGKTYVVSGSVPGYTRTTISERIEELGGTASSSVSSKTTALVSSETDTSKAKKAIELGIPVIDPQVFADMIA